MGRSFSALETLYYTTPGSNLCGTSGRVVVFSPRSNLGMIPVTLGGNREQSFDLRFEGPTALQTRG